MLHIDTNEKRELLLRGNVGLEKEGLRVDGDGFLAHTSHPFGDDPHIVRDFCENQTEINTSAHVGVAAAMEELAYHTKRIHETLAKQEPKEYLWPFSNPPYIRGPKDVPVAQFDGKESSKTTYREYLSDRYGRYKMALSGIHYNYSFADELLELDFAKSGKSDFKEYKNDLYLKLAKKVAAYGWIMVAVAAASPLLDSSYVEKGVFDQDVFQGLASLRCSELGYWNTFVPVLDYSSLEAYAGSIRYYVRNGFIKAPSELYYPVRLKPKGENRLESLETNGINHIELRMIDLNPLTPIGLDHRDAEFAQLLLGFFAATPDIPFTEADQVQAVQNFKNAAHYDLKTVNVSMPGGATYTVAHGAKVLIRSMREFYRDFGPEVHAVLDFEEAKFIDPENRYAWKIRREYGGGFVKQGMELAKRRQEER